MLRTIFAVLVTAVWTLIMFTCCIVSMLVTMRASTSLFWVQRVWSPVLIWAAGGRVEVTGTENIDPKRPTIYVSNHQSTADIPVIFMALKSVDLRLIAKAELRKVPIIGWYMSLANFVFVDRSNRADAVKSLQLAGKQIREGISVAVFPEGTRGPDGRILPFKKGAFALAMESKVAVCPMTIEGSGVFMPKNSWRFRPGLIRVRIGKPIDPTAFEGERDGLIRAVREEIIALNLALGGKGGDVEDAVAASGVEGIGRPVRDSA